MFYVAGVIPQAVSKARISTLTPANTDILIVEEVMSTRSVLSSNDIEQIRPHSTVQLFQAGDCIFSEGDEAQHVYFIESGRVSIFFEKFTSTDEIHTLGPGEYFGEMAILLNEKRNASAHTVEATTLLALDKSEFRALVQNNPEISRLIDKVLTERNEELVLRETLISSAGLDGKNLHVSIKGDPSLRETALFRERYESPVDKYLPDLLPVLEDLLINRCVYQIFIGFNSGEIRTTSLLNPFCDEIHQIRKLLDTSYIDRHFPKIDYMKKSETIKQFCQTLKLNSWFKNLPQYLHNIWGSYYEEWHPIPAEEISKTLLNLPLLRSIPNYYLRNITFSIVRDAIHMQFNCDGTHIVSAEDYERFLQENL